MQVPEFLIGDNTDYPDDVFIIHTAFPRFVMNLQTDDIEWLEEFEKADEKELTEAAETYIRKALEFYDREVERYENEA